jgi:hypothetical protein
MILNLLTDGLMGHIAARGALQPLAQSVRGGVILREGLLPLAVLEHKGAIRTLIVKAPHQAQRRAGLISVDPLAGLDLLERRFVLSVGVLRAIAAAVGLCARFPGVRRQPELGEDVVLQSRQSSPAKLWTIINNPSKQMTLVQRPDSLHG